MRRVGRAFALGAAIVGCGTVAAFLGFAFPRQQSRWVRRSLRFFLRLLAVKVSLKGDTSSLSGGTILVANHVSYLDIPVLAAVAPVAFLTSTEVRGLFPEGWMASVGGCIFIDRGRKRDVVNGVRDLQARLAMGTNAAFFPEATSTDGTAVLPFKSALFETAVLGEIPVVPVALRYRKGREIAAYYGNHRFLSHLWSLLSFESVEVDAVVLPAVTNGCRKEIAMECHRRIVRAISSPSVVSLCSFETGCSSERAESLLA